MRSQVFRCDTTAFSNTCNASLSFFPCGVLWFFTILLLSGTETHDNHISSTERMKMKPDLWINGTFVPWDEAGVHPLCHSLQRGSTLFESIDCNEAANGRPAIFRLREHIARLGNSAAIVGMELPYTGDEIERAVVDTVARSGMKRCIIRPLALYADVVMEVYPGPIPVSVVIGLGDAVPHPDSIRITISRLRKIDGMCMPYKAKVSGNYIGPMIAKAEAVRKGFDDTIILDREGNVAEGSTSNIFIVESGRLVTAPENAILPGITRDSIIVIAGSLGIDVVQEPFDGGRLKRADEVILCSSGKGVAPVVQVDDTAIGDGVPGEITRKLRDRYDAAAAGRIPELEYWLTYV